MSTKKTNAIIEHKLSNAAFPFPSRGVNFRWCYQNSTSLHEHDYYEFVIITHGKIKHFHNSETCIASKGMLFLVKPGELHQFLPFHNSSAKHINFCITPVALRELSQSIWQEDLSKSVEQWRLPHDLYLPPKDFESILNSIDRLSRFPAQSLNTYAVIKSIILEILIFLFHKMETLSTSTIAEVRPAWLNSFLDTLNDPSVFTLKLKDIYPLAPYSQSMLNIYFNKYMGTTLITYITNLKISYACTLLRYTDSTPLDISTKLGYDSLSHFNRVFKRIAGKSPIAYRKEISAPAN